MSSRQEGLIHHPFGRAQLQFEIAFDLFPVI